MFATFGVSLGVSPLPPVVTRCQGYPKFGVNRFCDFCCIRDSFSVAKGTSNSELIATFGVSLGVFLKYTPGRQGATGCQGCYMLLDAVDRTENEKYCCGSHRK